MMNPYSAETSTDQEMKGRMRMFFPARLTKMTRRTFIASSLALCAFPPTSRAQSDPLPSWNDTRTKQAIVEFVTRATASDGPGFVPKQDRIAVFDMDGTLIPEKPVPAALVP